MKNFLTTLLFLMSISLFSQEVDFKKGIVYIDGKECLKYESETNNVSFQDLNGNDIMVLKFLREYGTVYTEVIFFESKKRFSSRTYIFTKKSLIEKLIKSNTLFDCKIDTDKVKIFVQKYDEKG